MQQAYRAIRVVAETQTIRIVLHSQLDELSLQELQTVCKSLQNESSGIKALVLDFSPSATRPAQALATSPELLAATREAIEAVPLVVIAVIASSMPVEACGLIQAADMTLAASEATLCLPADDERGESETINGHEAERLKIVTRAVAGHQLKAELNATLDLLRSKSAAALQLAKAALRLGRSSQVSKLETLKQVNDFYLAHTMQTLDATEGLRAFLEKREPQWKNR